MKPLPKRRILFVSERVTLAQVVRLVTLAKALEPAQYEIHFACSRFDDLCFRGTRFGSHEVFSLTEADVFHSIERGRRLYEEHTLARYVEEELELFDAIRPELVIGDLRWSLSISAPLRKVPYAALINAYFSPFAAREAMPMPDHPIVSLLGVRLAERYFPRAVPHVFEHFARPVNRLRRRFGLPEVGSLLEVLTAGDYVLYPDVPLVAPTRDLPPTHGYLGPVFWEPDVQLVPAWNDLGVRHPLIYVTLGSSGNVRALPAVLEALAGLPVDVLLATAGRNVPCSVPDNVRVTDYVPGAAVAKRAALVVCNGGSSTAYQALAEGKPVLGVAHNLDQYLCMTAIATFGAGILARSANLTPAEARGAIERLLDNRSYRARAAKLAVEFTRWNSASRFRSFVAAAIQDRAMRPSFQTRDTEPELLATASPSAGTSR